MFIRKYASYFLLHCHENEFFGHAEGQRVGFCPSEALKSRLGLGTGRKEGEEENHWVQFIYFENRGSWGVGEGSSFAPLK